MKTIWKQTLEISWCAPEKPDLEEWEKVLKGKKPMVPILLIRLFLGSNDVVSHPRVHSSPVSADYG